MRNNRSTAYTPSTDLRISLTGRTLHCLFKVCALLSFRGLFWGQTARGLRVQSSRTPARFVIFVVHLDWGCPSARRPPSNVCVVLSVDPLIALSKTRTKLCHRQRCAA